MLEEEAKAALRELRYGDAITKLEQAVQLDPGFLRAQVRLADVLDRAGYTTRAVEIADRASKSLAPSGQAAVGDAVVLEARAVQAHVHGDLDGEVSARRTLVEQHGDDPALHLELARALDRRGRVQDAIPEVDLAIALDAKDPTARVLKGRLLSKLKRFDEASAAIDQAEGLVTETGNTVGRASVDRIRGDSEFLHERFAPAGALFEKASRAYAAAGLDFLAAQCRKAVGDCELKRGNLKEAIAIYEPVISAARLASDHRMVINALSSLGAQYQLRGQYEAAAKTLREARADALGLGNPLLLVGPTLNLASALGSLGPSDEARALAEESLNLARSLGNSEIEAKSMLVLANAQNREGHLDEAARIYQEVLGSPALAGAAGAPPGNAHLGLAKIFRQQGRLKDAAESADAAVAFNREKNQRALLGYSLVQRARVRIDLGLDAEARADLDEAAKLAIEPPPPLEDLQFDVGIARARLAASKSRWDDAEGVLAGLRRAAWSEPGASTDTALLAFSASVANERNRSQDAIRYASDAVSNRQGSPVDRAGARIELARALLRTAKNAEAASEAQRGLDEADRMGLPIVTAAACALLMSVGGTSASEANSVHGLAALQRYVDAAPENRREALRARTDLQTMTRALKGQ
jgi:tetratricopeptide (TPR) repeat protein